MANEEKFTKAIEALKADKTKEIKFDQTVDLIINLKEFDVRRNAFNLFIQVPNKIKDKKIGAFLEKDSKWKGISGNYIITLGKNSKAEKGDNKNLQTLKSSVGAFTRMWLGVRPASGLAVSDELFGSDDLLDKLDKAFLIPEPRPDWEY